ncbi:SMI1/KNR4 family protein [Thermomonospora curvata]|uniref:Knr4/Smi1-like domain-containing protein n=1 Tax=Thermomonospora curvata (strain ATCC 19995 / DSM 43183 / JCM 3096 / KCTC 9072 / NBRC 15933 / NCIMB 10081 / Henssen B9) TaxID=471852 RepID=D1ABA7_THECD|nr:SMI1/KNR4 family protein [Thermomonospora curvata]ACY97143.1 hypothetical protein Tcur_1567 [Thermomonospora curvata DSM 43183]PKK15005.1 MAG: hypothetical protein BUE48_007645 [Thermomonospora sp. CIF 1]
MASELDPPAAEHLRSVAAAVYREAPSGWLSATLSCVVTPISVSRRLVYHRPEGPVNDRLFDLPLDPFHSLCRRGGAGQAHVDLTVQSSGDYQALVIWPGEHGPFSGFRSHLYLLDPGADPLQPGDEEDGPADASPAGDPQEAVHLLREVMRIKYEILGRTEPPRPPASTAMLELLQQRSPVPLPADLLALYRVSDGGPLTFDDYEWLSLSELVGPEGSGGRLEDGRYNRPGWETGWNHTVLETDPLRRVRRVTGHLGWIPFAHDGGGNYLAVDMAPGPGGRPGQVIEMGRDYDDGALYRADSVTGLLRMELKTLKRGDYEAPEEDYVELFGPEWEQPADRYAWQRRIDARRATLASVGPEVQRLIVLHGTELDLRPLRNAPRLRDITLTCRNPDLSVLRELPVENLELRVDTVDLTPLTGHPTLRTVVLTTEQPVRIAPLSTLPKLYGLDLAEAAVGDLEHLAGATTPRFLMLALEQWQELRKRTDRPPAPAVAALAGDTVRHQTALEWAAGFPRFRPPAVARLTGRLEP